MAGWGLTDPSDPSSIPAQLQWAATVVQPPTYCAANDGLPFDSAMQFCTVHAPYYDNSFCHGDSGGPLIANYLSGQSGTPTEIGVISNSPGCSTSAPDVYTRADTISSWVNSEIAAAALASPAPPGSTSMPPPVEPPTALPPAAVTTGRMLLSEAKSDVRQVLSHVMGRRFRKRPPVRLQLLSRLDQQVRLRPAMVVRRHEHQRLLRRCNGLAARTERAGRVDRPLRNPLGQRLVLLALRPSQPLSRLDQARCLVDPTTLERADSRAHESTCRTTGYQCGAPRVCPMRGRRRGARARQRDRRASPDDSDRGQAVARWQRA